MWRCQCKHSPSPELLKNSSLKHFFFLTWQKSWNGPAKHTPRPEQQTNKRSGFQPKNIRGVAQCFCSEFSGQRQVVLSPVPSPLLLLSVCVCTVCTVTTGVHRVTSFVSAEQHGWYSENKVMTEATVICKIWIFIWPIKIIHFPTESTYIRVVPWPKWSQLQQTSPMI